MGKMETEGILWIIIQNPENVDHDMVTSGTYLEMSNVSYVSYVFYAAIASLSFKISYLKKG